MKRLALYIRVSTTDQHPETQLYDLRQMAQQRGLTIVSEYTDKISGTKAKRPGLDQLLADGGALGRAVVVIISALAEMERSLIIDRVRSGLRRAKLEGVRIGRPPADVDRQAIIRDRRAGRSLSEVASAHRISRAMVCKVMKNIKDSA